MNFAKLPHSLYPTLPLIIETQDLADKIWKYALLTFLIGTLIYLIYYFKLAQKQKPIAGYLRSRKKNIEIEREIFNIQKKAQTSSNFREAAHELASLLREYIEEENFYKLKITALTVEELEKVLESRNTKELFQTLEEIQFQSNPPFEKDLEEVISKTKQITKEKYFSAIVKR